MRYPNPNRPLTAFEAQFVRNVIECPDRPLATSARLAGYSMASAGPVTHRLVRDPRIVAALDAAGLDVSL
jgi:phage terminase small subunit